ncbi:bifunctional 4-hydroxy-2-oxoglutarate aldolase/2-dehydro-3-deoxy-phosphogluconate aldolase [Venatoribacter cucullus]|uniref:bifunctional 4-hydroxy-2-oxoglutarate aldolase/2-dehydro-3-deoxy-phosphogluconate aldolase n=1 Tax=Venatoribacter cucullus TaxID=2661630 RepID=UPI00223F6D47|nr:bifunctional 4-hydroxy-2-oxoglutarate aldolase/2-dehydro-3-deoxy-phosphogluconate aldolase [Venatoribacter cucullus]UZK03335.1 bifunctional 4-hydroxy-2-oxoglutarate aldolase/2-dehydro-3-deoxy-phosphogluconate aldolase [Venatoribacter cucullus]
MTGKHHGNDVWNLWLERAKPLIPVMVIDDITDAIPMAQALVAGGVRLLEVTLRTSCALDAIRLIRQTVPDVIVGAGTVTSAVQLQAAVEQGAEFIVSPGISAELLQAAVSWGGPYLPGVATASEVMQARTAGFRHQKFFPAAVAGGEAMLKALKGPFYDVKFCPTGGIGQDNYQDYLQLENVFAVGGSWLTPAELVAAKNWPAITTLAIAG